MTSSARASSALSAKSSAGLPAERIDSCIYLVRGQKVLLDRHLSELYGTTTRLVNQAVRRNLDRFPADFLLELTREEIGRISQFETSSGLKYSKTVYTFTEQGVAMLSGLLNSPRAIQVNIEIMRAFVRMRQMMTEHADLARKLNSLEKKYDQQFKVVFEAIRELMEPVDEEDSVKEIGFHTIIKTTPSHK